MNARDAIKANLSPKKPDERKISVVRNNLYSAQQESLELHLQSSHLRYKDQLEEPDHSEGKSMLNILPALDVKLS
ncbi:hypothetical protein CF319_g8363 [Tilletia indica]|nr:hypothetical protein CF319_g8363 [Tilletia indica]